MTPTDDELDSLAQDITARLTSILGRLPYDEPAGMNVTHAARLSRHHDRPDPYRKCDRSCPHDFVPGILVGPLLERDGDYKTNHWIVNWARRD